MTEKAEGVTVEKEESGCLGMFALLFILVFFMPILWLAEKIQGPGGGSSGFGSLVVAIIVIAMTICSIIAAVVGSGIYMWRIM